MNITLQQSQSDVICYVLDTNSAGNKPGQVTGTKENSPFSNKISLLAVPNPNNGQASIFYSLGGQKSGDLFIRDVQGHLIERFAITHQKDKVEINFSSLASGIYFLTLINCNQEMIHQKMIITR